MDKFSAAKSLPPQLALLRASGDIEMDSASDWAAKVEGKNCPFDMPRTGISSSLVPVHKMSISTLFLERIQTYRGHCVLIFDSRHVTRIDELESEEWRLLSEDILNAEKALIEVLRPDHINIASLGLVVPHLHWHLIPRYIGDPRWGGPIWTTAPDEMEKVYLPEVEYVTLAGKIRSELVGADS